MSKYQIPFDKDDRMLSYPETWKGLIWKDNYTFSAAMKYDGYGRGRSAATIYLKDQATNKQYPMFLSTFDELMKTPGRMTVSPTDGQLLFTGQWTFVKKGQNYALTIAK